MSNALEAIAPKILARGMMHFRQKAIMPRLINSDFSAEAAQKGDTIDIPVANTESVNVGEGSERLVRVQLYEDHGHLLLHLVVMFQDPEHCFWHVIHYDV